MRDCLVHLRKQQFATRSQVFIANLNTPGASVDRPLIAHEVLCDESCLLARRRFIRAFEAVAIRDWVVFGLEDQMINWHSGLAGGVQGLIKELNNGGEEQVPGGALRLPRYLLVPPQSGHTLGPLFDTHQTFPSR